MKAIDEVKRLMDMIASGEMPPDEPVVTMRARDPNAPAAVLAWIVASHDSKVPDEKLNATRQEVADMQHWPTKQVPGRPETRTYKGVSAR